MERGLQIVNFELKDEFVYQGFDSAQICDIRFKLVQDKQLKCNYSVQSKEGEALKCISELRG